MSETKKVAIYCRLSEEDRDKAHPEQDSESIQNQKSMLVKHALEQGWELYNIYSDDDYTGADRRRPQFCQLLKDAEARRFDIILCKTQSRFTRELELVEKYIHGLFPLWGIRFVSIVDNADTDNKGNKKSRQINGLVNEWYLEDLSDNIKEVLTDRRQRGFHIGSYALFGYIKDPNKKGGLIIDPEAAEIVRDVFRLFDAGYGKTNIARIMNERGIPNPAEYKRLKGMPCNQALKPTIWKYYTVSSMLANEMYIGNMVQARYGSISYKTKECKPRPEAKWIKVENTHEPIIDKELWDSVQRKREERAKPFTSGSDAGKLGVFTGKVRCMNCGYTMRMKKNRDRYYLQCGTAFFSKDACIGSFIPQTELAQYVMTEVQYLIQNFFNQDKAEQLLEQHNPESPQAKIEHIKNEIHVLERKREEITEAKSQLYLDKMQGMISAEDYQEVCRNFSHKQTALSEKIQKQKEYMDSYLQMIEQIEKKSDIFEKYLYQTTLTRDIMDVLIVYIEVGKRVGQRGKGEIPIKIHWKF